MLHNQLFGIEVLMDGKPLREYSHDGKTYIVGVSRKQYSLRLINRSRARVLFICTVDGLSIMDGKPGDLNASSGYVVSPGNPADIPGWRLSDAEAALFVFGGPGESYASKMGKPQNIGVIGCAIFEEKSYTPPPAVTRSLGDFGPMRGATFGSEEATRGLGTGFGDRVGHQVSRTSFDRQSSPACVLTFHYDDVENLRAKGIVVEQVATGDPNPFPATNSEFCAPPAGWKG